MALRRDDRRGRARDRLPPGDRADELAHLVVLSEDEDKRGGHRAMWIEGDGTSINLWVPGGLLAAVEASRWERRRLERNVDMFRDAYRQLQAGKP
ncbi:hypothetical protein D3C72_1265640 [compost metagenome]